MNKSALFALITLLTGCATGYVASNGGDGYSETQLAEDNFQVTFRGSTKTTNERAYDFALLRGAELALSKGYSFITVSLSATADNGTAGVVVNNLVMARRKPEVSVNVKMHKAKPGSGGLEATFIRSSIRKKYELGE